jgi:uncharacterized protein
MALQELRLQPQGRHWLVDQAIGGLDSLTPCRGELLAIHHGSVLEVQGRADTIVTLCCDRCLQPFNHALKLEVRELLDLGSGDSAGRGGAGRDDDAASARQAAGQDARTLVPCGEDIDDRLLADGVFDPERWLFEQLHLLLPVANHCGSSCPGPARWSLEAQVDDPRWAALRTLRSS